MRAIWARLGGLWGGLALLTLALAGPGALAGPARQSASLNIVGVRFGGDDAHTRMVIDLDRAMSATPAPESTTRRIVLVLPSVATATAADGAGRGLIRSWSLRSDAAGAHLVLDLAGEARIAHRFLITPSDEVANWRYVIDVEGGGAPAPVPAPQIVAAPTTAPVVVVAPRRAPRLMPVDRVRVTQAATVPPRGGRKVIVIDAGHGGHDPGAQAADANEKDITLAAALDLRTRLERDGRYKVVMTRAADVFVPLESRVQIARRAGADLFISLHADSAGLDPLTHGASVYTLSDHGETRVTEVLGAHEWFTRVATRGTDPAVGQILLDLTQRGTLNRSALFAGLLVGRIGQSVDLLPNTHRDAGYYVLLAPDVPAVLIEMGFISSPLDEARLTDPAQRGRLADAIAGAIDTYFTSQTEVAAR
ncbi:MAG: N-acetylmuramoyl-L-alanine amidase [Pseudomonadota bacterium]|nr:N-acetylmuramoyl-L-alanine amidase [Pseudomonadota bacterium]